MSTIAIGDIHGDLTALHTLMGRLPKLSASDTLVFLGDYVDRGPDSAGVVRYLMHELPRSTDARIVTLRGNHEDAWLRVVDEGWPGFILPAGNGCLPCLRSFLGMAPDDAPNRDQYIAMHDGSFFPDDVIAWMQDLPLWHEDEHGLYVHAGVPQVDGRWLHPSEVDDPHPLLWSRSPGFFLEYDGKLMVVGHTGTSTLPQQHSLYTPDDPDDIYWAGSSAYGIDTGAGKDGFLSALQLPNFQVYESR